MPCYHPLHGFKGPINENGKRPVIWKAPAGSDKQDLPCGQCVGCRLERSRQWAMRCLHEAKTHEENSFITLTYNKDHLPVDGSLDLSHYQKFMKRLRKEAKRAIRFFHCGEYGEKLGRPHYHALLFGYDFRDKKLWKEKNGFRLYTSEQLSGVWGKGHAIIGDVTFESAAYVARYILKKRTNKEEYTNEKGIKYVAKDIHYLDANTGVVRRPEYTTMSRRPGIGRNWFDLYADDVYPSDEVIINGQSVKPPRYYDNLLDKLNPSLLDYVKSKRLMSVPGWRREVQNGCTIFVHEVGPDRLAVKEEVQENKIKLLMRELEGSYENNDVLGV